MDDFSPAAVARKVPPLRKLLEARQQLSNLRSYMTGRVQAEDLLQKLLSDDRLQWLARLTGDSHDGSKMGAEGLVKPLRIARGLSDLPWHKDCGQGRHSLLCNAHTSATDALWAGTHLRTPPRTT